MPARLRYDRFARHLRQLPLDASIGDLIAWLLAYGGTDAEYRHKLVAAVCALPPGGEWLRGLAKICDVLKADNPRFDCGLFMEWVMEGK